MSHHNRGIQRRKIQRGNRDLIESFNWVNDRSSLILLIRAFHFHSGNEKVLGHGLSVELGHDFNLLTASEEVVEWDSSNTSHFHVVDEAHEFVQESLREVGVLLYKSSELFERLYKKSKPSNNKWQVFAESHHFHFASP